MKLVREVATLEEELRGSRHAGRSIGFVPTMGALHPGHVSLMKAARGASAQVVTSIFVNPLQFGPKEDFARYPRSLEGDAEQCARAGVDLLFVPEVAEMYPEGFCTSVEVSGLSDTFEGAVRPGHFRGVATVVLKLLNLVRPDRAYFGQKDFQQTVVLRRMVKDLEVPCQLEVLPTLREPDGLAMSSRNVYLGTAERAVAPTIYRSLQAIVRMAESSERDVSRLRARGLEELATAPAIRLDYLEIVSAETLEPMKRVEGSTAAIIAARLGTTRLIDNILLPIPGHETES
jgi:pantoate--beta-alanine ligase